VTMKTESAWKRRSPFQGAQALALRRHLRSILRDRRACSRREAPKARTKPMFADNIGEIAGDRRRLAAKRACK